MTSIQATRALVLGSVAACKWLAARYPDPAELKDRLNDHPTLFKAACRGGLPPHIIHRVLAKRATELGFVSAADVDVQLVYEAAK